MTLVASACVFQLKTRYQTRKVSSRTNKDIMSNVTTPSAPTPAASGTGTSKSESGGSSGSSSSSAAPSEDDLRKQLRSALLSLNRREPLEPTYKKLLERNTLTRKAATIPKNKFYKRIGSRLRERVEVYTREMQGKDPFDRISQRKPMDEAGMRAAFTLREAKEHEQQPLLEATLSTMAMHPERKRLLDGMALGLQTRNKKKPRTTHSPIFGNSAAAQTQMARQRAELERQKNQAKQWEEARMQRERDDRRQRVEEMEESRRIMNHHNDGGGSSGSNALQKIIEQVCKKYWDMEFPNLGGTNPFRIVIDRKSAPTIAPDYFNIITTPMNLTYVKDKTKGRKYTTLNQFFADIDLIIENALKYNMGEANPYRIASEDLKKKHTKIVKGVWKQIKEKQKLQNKS